MKRLVSLLLLAGATALMAQEGQPMRLQECISYAEQHNITLQSGGLDVSAAEINLKQAKLRMTPTVSAGLGQSFGYSHGTSSFDLGGNYSINAGIDIFKGLTIRNGIKQSELQLTQAQLQVEQEKNQIRIDIVRSYLTILMNQEMLGYQRNVLESSRQQVTEGEQRYKVGQILESDYLLLKAQYTSDSVNIENTLISIDNEYVTLHNLLNMKRDERFSVVEPGAAELEQAMQVPELEEVLRQALGYLPEMKYRENAVEIAEYDVKIAKGGYYPSITANAGVSTGYSAAYGGDYNGLRSGLYKGLGENVGINVSIPIYSQGKVRNEVKLRELDVQRAELNLQNVENQLTKEIEAYHLSVRKAHNDYTLSEMQRAAYEANYAAYGQKFQYGAITAVDLLQQQTNYLNILNSYMQNKYNFLLQKKILDIYTGQQVTL